MVQVYGGVTAAARRSAGGALGIVAILCFLCTQVVAGETMRGEGGRWYTLEQAAQGEVLFQLHCAECHGPNGESVPNWHLTGQDGFLPPPPLNGTGHTWHHELPLLRSVIRDGGEQYGGRMPSFADKLSVEDIDALIAGFQSRWSDDIYRRWEKSVSGTVSRPQSSPQLQLLY